MARDVLIRLKKLSTTGKVPANAAVRFEPTVLRADADGYILDDYFDAVMVDGEATVTDLPETDLNWAYKVQIRGHGRGAGLKQVYATWYVHLPAGEDTVNFEDLPRIDPKTLTPVNDPDPAWVDAVAAVFTDSVAEAVPTTMVAEAQNETGQFRLALNQAIEKPLRPTIPDTGIPVTIQDAANRNPYWLGRDRRTIYSGGSSSLYLSKDDGETWQLGTSFQFSPWIRGIRELGNGELMVSTAAYQGVPGKLFVSTGWGTGNITWTKKLDAGAGGVGNNSAFSNNWGMDVYENIVVVAEYGLQQPGNASRFVYLSEDHGETWRLIYDIGTAPSAHVHAAFYDPWWKAIWVTQGDQTNRAIKVSFDMGETFTTVDNPDNVQVVGGIALPGCILFGTDYQPDGIFRVERTQDRTGLVIKSAYAMYGGATDRRRFIGGLPFWTGRKGDPILFPFVSDESWTDSGRLIATEDGYTFKEVWKDTQTYQFKGLSTALGPTITGQYHGSLTDNRGWATSRVKWSYLPPVVDSTEPPVQVRTSSGTATDGEVLTAGKYAVANGAIGTVQVLGGSLGRENVIGGNLANVGTATSNLDGATPLTSPDGNWVTITGGQDNVVRGHFTVVNGSSHKVADGANHVAIGGGSNATVNAGVTYGTIAGGTLNKLTGNISTVGGGQANEAGLNATVAGGLTNKATANGATVSGGGTNTASGTSSTIAGGSSNTASGLYATVLGGNSNTASGDGAMVAGRENTASGGGALATGRGAVAPWYGQQAHAAGKFTTDGDAQASMWVLKRETTSATPADLAPWDNAIPRVAENQTVAFEAIVVARRADADGENAAWKVSGLLARNAGDTNAIVGTPTVTQIAASTGAAAWTLGFGTYSQGHMRFTVTGEAGKTIRWVARIVSAQVIG